MTNTNPEPTLTQMAHDIALAMGLEPSYSEGLWGDIRVFVGRDYRNGLPMSTNRLWNPEYNLYQAMQIVEWLHGLGIHFNSIYNRDGWFVCFVGMPEHIKIKVYDQPTLPEAITRAAYQVVMKMKEENK